MLKQYWFSFFIIAVLCINLFGCATVPPRADIESYALNGVSYVPLMALCRARGVGVNVDLVGRLVALTNEQHRITLMLNETVIVVDGAASHITSPVRFHQGMIMVPRTFKEKVFDVIFEKPRFSLENLAAVSSVKKIVLDAGHGGHDPGAIGRNGLREKDVTLDIVKRLAGLLRDAGFQVILVRDTDTFVPLDQRVTIANNAQADLFLSIHANANRARALNGFEAYYISPTANDGERALKSTHQDHLPYQASSFANHGQTLRAILWDMQYAYARGESIALAKVMCQSVENSLPAKVLGVEHARFQVLKGTFMPAVLLEVGFLSNSAEEQMLKNGYYRQQLADTIFKGVKNYVREFALAEVRQ
ncbi:MAG: N-acetylmuramoyl-L-alanine amidase [Candidatus Omnitrophica bacterium]|nr:N-acetylmuramoyl-L-alanine amidase [Candidatus Omnitrophota bacterium]